MTAIDEPRPKHIPRRSGVGIRQVFGPHPWRARIQWVLSQKPATPNADARRAEQ